MKLVCAPNDTVPYVENALNVTLYGQAKEPNYASAGEAAKREIRKAGLVAAPKAWDFLSIALSVVTADAAGLRSESPDGWTRTFSLQISVGDPEFWNSKSKDLSSALSFLTTDLWEFSFVSGGIQPAPPRKSVRPNEDAVVLLSGGLDSLIGAIDLAKQGHKLYAVSNVVRGDGDNQDAFAQAIGEGLSHLALNHNATPPWKREQSQRARSIIFLAFGILVATALGRYRDGEEVPLFLCENGFIAINPPLTGTRIGSLSTRTAHPEFLNRIRNLLVDAGVKVKIENPYEFSTKGEMMSSCKDPKMLEALASRSVSCGRYRVFKYTHCGRCIPCQIRRASFLKANYTDKTSYVYTNLARNDAEHADFDDVRAVAMALAEVKDDGFDTWLGSALSYPEMRDLHKVRALIERGLGELSDLHKTFGVK